MAQKVPEEAEAVNVKRFAKLRKKRAAKKSRRLPGGVAAPRKRALYLAKFKRS